MTTLDRVNEILTDAKSLHAASLERLFVGDIRDASEKAWGATKRASDALILAGLGWEPERTPDTSRELGRLAQIDQRVRSLVPRYYSRMTFLHGKCFYLGQCDSVEHTERRIRETASYIAEAEYLATSQR